MGASNAVVDQVDQNALDEDLATLEIDEPEQEFHFDRDEFVSELTSYYDLLARMYMPESKIKRPPKDGWPQLSPQKLAFMGKDDNVLYILRHIPYIERNHYEEKYQIYRGCVAVDYTGSCVASQIDIAEQGDEPDDCEWNEIGMEEECIFPSDVVWIGKSLGLYGNWMILDTRRGTITLMNIMGGPEWTDLSEPGCEFNQEWREYPTWTFKDFFATAKEQLKTLELMPMILPNTIWIRQADNSAEDKQRRKIFEDHGWPTESYDKEGCVKNQTQLLKLEGW